MLVPLFCNPSSGGRENPAPSFPCPFPAGQGAAPLQSPFYRKLGRSPVCVRAYDSTGCITAAPSRGILRGNGTLHAFKKAASWVWCFLCFLMKKRRDAVFCDIERVVLVRPLAGWKTAY